MKKFVVCTLVVVLSFGLVFGRGLLKKTVPFHSKANEHLVFTADEAIVATSVRGDGIYLWSTEENDLLKRLQGSDTARPLAFQPGSRTLLAVQNEQLVLWLSNGARMELQYGGKRGKVQSAAYCNDGSLIALLCSGSENTLEVVSEFDTELIMTIPNVRHYAWCQQDLLAVASKDTVQLWDINAGIKLKEYPLQSGSITGLCYLPKEQRLVSCSINGDLYVWGTSPDERRRKVHDRPYKNIGPIEYGSLRTWDGMPQYLAASTSKEVKIWRFYGGELQKLTVQNKLENEHQRFSGVSPQGNFTTVYKYSQGVGHVLHLTKVLYTVPKSNH